MTEHTPNRNLPYPDGTDSPDAPGQIAALALALDAENSYVGWNLASNQSYGTGTNALLRFGKLRVLLFSIVNNFDVEIGSGFLQVPNGDQPGSRVSGGGFLITSSGRSPAAYSLQADRSIVLAAGPGGTGNTHEGSIVYSV